MNPAQPGEPSPLCWACCPPHEPAFAGPAGVGCMGRWFGPGTSALTAAGAKAALAGGQHRQSLRGRRGQDAAGDLPGAAACSGRDSMSTSCHAVTDDRGRQRSALTEQGVLQRYGDEPLLIARSTGVPVYVGASRYEAGLAGGKRTRGARASIFWTMDSSTVNWHATWTSWWCTAAICNERLLPAGRLREPLSSLWRADVIVLRQEDAELESALRAYVRSGMLLLASAAQAGAVPARCSERLPSAPSRGRTSFSRLSPGLELDVVERNAFSRSSSLHHGRHRPAGGARPASWL